MMIQKPFTSFLLCLLLPFLRVQSLEEQNVLEEGGSKNEVQPGFTDVSVISDSESTFFGDVNGRLLQIAPDDCQSVSDRFVCRVVAGYFIEDNGNTNITNLDAQFNCLLDPLIQMDYRRAPDCSCAVTLTRQDDPTIPPRLCGCGSCEVGAAQALAVDCSNNDESPFVFDTCTSFTCDQKCNGTVDINQPTEPPVTSVEPTSGVGSLPSGFIGVAALTFVSMIFL